MSGRIPQGGETREERAGRILNDYLDRRARGTAEPEADLLTRHPDLAAELRLQLSLLHDLRRSGDSLESLVARGLLRSSPDPRYPAQLGAFKVTAFLGRGGMGVVVQAYEESLNRTVALKVLRPELAVDASALTRFEREAKAAAALRHPNIVTVYAVGADHGVHFMAMEYIDGPTLAEVIRTAAPSTEPGSVNPELPPTEPGSVNPHGSGGPPLQRWGSDSSQGRRGSRQAASAQRSTEPGSVNPDPQNSALSTQHFSSLPPDLVRDIFRQLLSALAAAHAAGLIHRDVKPANILLDGWRAEGKRVGATKAGAPTAGGKSEVGSAVRTDGSAQHSTEPGSVNPDPQHSELSTQHCLVKLADFGLARMVSAQTRVTLPSAVLGTPEYMSPEQARGVDADGGLDHRADLYSAGVVLYEMLTGRTPFRADTPSAVIHRILHEEPRDPRALYPAADPHLAALALRLMAKRPEDRFASANEALTALDQGTRIALLEQRRRTRRRAAALAGVLAILAGAAWLVARPGGLWDRLSSRSNAGTGRMTSMGDESPAPLAEVKADENKRTILVRSVGEAWRPFQEFPDAVLSERSVVLLDANGHGQQLVVAGLHRPLENTNLVAFDARTRKRKWGLYLHDEQERLWPECQKSGLWECPALAAGDMDDNPGQELIVAANDMGQYPTRISIVAPGKRTLGPTFWHLGTIAGVQVQPDFFRKGHPAIVAWGANNKLDGFDERHLPGDDKQQAHWDFVPVLMILDPANMNGLGPPRIDPSRGVTLPTAHPYAYAFFDAPLGVGVPEKPESNAAGGRLALEDETASFEFVEPPNVADDGATGPWFRIGITTWPMKRARVELTVDRDLQIQSILRVPQASAADKDNNYWRKGWRVVIREGKYPQD
jgi:serine/threonine protein kinase